MAEDAPLAPSIGDPFWRRGGKPEQRLACAPEPPDGVWIPMLATLGSPPNEWRIGDGFVNWGEDALIVRLSASTDRGATANDVVAFAQLYDVDVAAVVGQADRPLGHAELQDDGRSRAFAIRLPITPNRAFEPTHRLAVDVGLYRLGRDGAAKRMAVESVLFDTLDGPRTMLPYAPAEGAEIVDGSAARLIVLGPSVPSLSRYRLPAPPPGAVPFGAAMSLLRSTVHRTPTALFVDLTWRADPLAPLSDYTISVQAAADDASWHAQHDGTPALGAIPTLKWLSGMVIHDRHRIPLPLEAAGQDGPFTVTVGVYDAFSLEPLPVTDGDLVRQGQGQRAIIYPSP